MKKGYDVGPLMERYRAVKVDLPNIIANTCQLVFINEFNRSEWDGKQWEPRKNSKNTKHLLVDSGTYRIALNNCIKSATWSKVIFAVDLDYAAYQNYGTEHIPARKAIGDGKEVRAKVKNAIRKQMRKIFKLQG